MTETAFSSDPQQNELTAQLVLILTQMLHLVEALTEDTRS